MGRRPARKDSEGRERRRRRQDGYARCRYARVESIDVHPESSRPVDYPKVGDRLRDFGIALYKGDAVMVTLVKVKRKNIEFHLGGGGAKESGAPYTSTYVPKSNREKRLEDAYDRETDPARKRRLKEDLDDERRRRRYEEEQRRREAEYARQIAKATSESCGLRADRASTSGMTREFPSRL